MTFGKNAALALDYWCCSIFFNQRDITISALTWALEQDRVASLNLFRWQLWALSKIGPWLDRHWPNHRAEARAGDIERINAVLKMLQ
jgi:hypothetical protein